MKDPDNLAEINRMSWVMVGLVLFAFTVAAIALILNFTSPPDVCLSTYDQIAQHLPCK